MSRLLAAVLGVGVIVGAVGCTPGGATPDPAVSSASGESAAPATAAPTDSPEPTSTATPDSDADTSAAEAELPAFTEVMDAVWADSRSVAGRDYIDALVDAGFEKDAMEVTRDRTTVDNPADSIQFSVRVGDGCLVGQVGPSVDGPVARVLPEVPGGTCLIGETRPIDW